MAHLPIWYIGQIPDEQLNKANEELIAIPSKAATMGIEGETVNSSDRNTTVRFAPHDHWFGHSMFDYGQKANLACNWGFHLDRFEAIQYAEYGVNQHYRWHQDTFFLSEKDYDRKVTIVVLMNDPSEFKGGELKLRFAQKEHVVPLIKGTVIAFPSFIDHCVTDVTEGKRYTSAMWVNGPRFR
jgi:PKHD-type hydroxylase